MVYVVWKLRVFRPQRKNSGTALAVSEILMKAGVERQETGGRLAGDFDPPLT